MDSFRMKIHRIFPFIHEMKEAYIRIQKKYYCAIAKKEQKKKLHELKGKKKIKSVIILFDVSMFREYLYKLLQASGRFDVTIVVSPQCSHGEEHKKRQLSATYQALQKKGYQNVIMGYDINSGKYFDIKKELNPDIVFYTNPYRGLISEEHYVTKFLDALTIYLPYYINNTVEYKMAYDELMHNVVWRYYVETEWHRKLSQKYSSNHSRNVVVTGYSGVDRFLDKDYKPSEECWKIKDKKHKRIVWAPHQTIDPNKEMYYSAFLLIADQMTAFAEKYKDSVQIAFKPHPLLLKSLSLEWGLERAEAYYNKWRMMDNTCIVEGEYADLFLTSDAIIHDSASFITEYLMLNKPALRTYNGRDPKTQFNEFSLACLEHYYKALNANDVENFIIDVINDVDPMKDARGHFVNEHLLPPNAKLPSQNIVVDIINSIDEGVLYRN